MYSFPDLHQVREVAQWLACVLVRRIAGLLSLTNVEHSTCVLQNCQDRAPAWCNKDRAMCDHVYLIMHVKGTELLVEGVGYPVLV